MSYFACRNSHNLRDLLFIFSVCASAHATTPCLPRRGDRNKIGALFQQADQSNENQSSFGLFGCCQSCCICGSGGQTTEVSCGNCWRSGEPILRPGRAWSGSESKGN